MPADVEQGSHNTQPDCPGEGMLLCHSSSDSEALRSQVGLRSSVTAGETSYEIPLTLFCETVRPLQRCPDQAVLSQTFSTNIGGNHLIIFSLVHLSILQQPP